jgi:beta-1,4-N-acetylglucosaminyltransferase
MDADVRGHAPLDLLLVCSAGGHLLQLRLLEEVWRDRSRLWVTHRRDDAVSLLAAEDVVFAHGPTTRNVGNLLRNVALAWQVVRRHRPRVVLTTGAGIAVPFAWVGRLHGAEVVYVESLTRVGEASLSCRLIRPIASRTYVQWPELARRLRGVRYVGSVLGGDA